MTELPGLPTTGLPAAQVLARLAALRADDLPVEGGRLFAYVFEHGDDALTDLQHRALAEFSAVNMLDPTAFPSVVAMENDVVGALLDLFGAPDGAVGTFTSGGTESCLLAVRSAVQLFRAGRRGRAVAAGTEPELLLAQSAHPAFGKAAEWLGLRVVTVPVDPVTLTPRAESIAAAIDSRTALVVVSAVSYPHGVLDPVAEVAEVCAVDGVPLHVDGCIGALPLAARRALGEPVPPFDLAVDGVTSMSVDLHKYGYTSKGASAVLFRDRELRRASWFGYGAWAGYPLLNTTLQSTKSAGPLAAAWVTLQALGGPGYLALLRPAIEAARRLVAAVDGIDGLRVLGEPAAALVALAAAEGPDGRPPLDVGQVADRLRAADWHVQQQLAFGAAPASLHLTLDAAAARTVEELITALAEAVHQVTADPAPALPAELIAAVRALDVTSLTPTQLAALLGEAGLGRGRLVVDARVSALLQALDPRDRGTVLELVADGVFSPTRAGRTDPADRG